MRLSRAAFAAVVVGCFALGLWGVRELGVWRPRVRALPTPGVTLPVQPAPGGLPM